MPKQVNPFNLHRQILSWTCTSHSQLNSSIFQPTPQWVVIRTSNLPSTKIFDHSWNSPWIIPWNLTRPLKLTHTSIHNFFICLDFPGIPKAKYNILIPCIIIISELPNYSVLSIDFTYSANIKIGTVLLNYQFNFCHHNKIRVIHAGPSHLASLKWLISSPQTALHHSTHPSDTLHSLITFMWTEDHIDFSNHDKTGTVKKPLLSKTTNPSLFFSLLF